MSPLAFARPRSLAARPGRRGVLRLLAAAAALVVLGGIQFPVAASSIPTAQALAVHGDAGSPVPSNAMTGSLSYADARIFGAQFSDARVYIWPTPTGGYYVCGSGSGNAAIVMAPINLPAGTKLYRLDFLGFSASGSTLSWQLLDYNVTTGTGTEVTSGAFSAEGVTDDPVGWGSGVTLAPGHQWIINTRTTPCTTGFVGATFQYVTPAPLTYVPIVPARVYDSRFADGKLATGATRTLGVATSTASGHPTVVPSTAVAVTYNLTVVDTAAKGFLALYPAGTAFPNNSSINWFGSDQILANGGTVSLGSSRQIAVRAGGTGASTNFVIDITGYYKP